MDAAGRGRGGSSNRDSRCSARLSTLGLREGDQIDVRSGFIGVRSSGSRFVVDCRAGPRWIPAYPDRLEPDLARRLAVVAAEVCGRSWRGSAKMAHAVRSALEAPDALGDVLARVVGRGPGFTPAGDDVLVGILAVLSSPHSGLAGAKVAESLGRLILPLLPTTTDVSGQLLRQAANGLFGRAVHELVSALIGDQPRQKLAETVRRILETGATSGADTCEGLLAFAPTFLVPHDKGLRHEYALALLPQSLQGLGFADDGVRQGHGRAGDRRGFGRSWPPPPTSKISRRAGLGEFEVRPNDLVVAVSDARRLVTEPCKRPMSCSRQK